MTHILIVYGTTDGHTRKIAQVVAKNLRARRCCVDVVDAAGYCTLANGLYWLGAEPRLAPLPQAHPPHASFSQIVRNLHT